MQQMLYDSNAYVVTVYYDNPTAYRSDRWTNFTRSLPPTACCCSSTARGHPSITPVVGTRGRHLDRPTSPGLILGAVVGGVGLFLIGYWLGRRRPSDYDVE